MAATSSYNYEAAFLAYCRGGALAEIAMTLGIPLEYLEERRRVMGWKRMLPEFEGQQRALSNIEVSSSLIQQNRDRSLQEAEPLLVLYHRQLEVFDRWWTELSEWEARVPLKLQELEAAEADYRDNPTPLATEARNAARQAYESTVFNRNQCRKAAAPGPKALADLANAVAAMQDIRYRALGDLPAAKLGTDPKAVQAIKQEIAIYLPGAIGAPRRMKQAETIDAQELPPKT